jgi:hypothetical protein
LTVQIFEALAHNWERPGRRRGPVAANLQLAREGFGFELRRGTFHVLLDGNDVASIEWKQVIEVPIEPGHHTLQSGRVDTPAEDAPSALLTERSSTSAATAAGAGPSTSRPSSSPTWHSGSSASDLDPRRPRLGRHRRPPRRIGQGMEWPRKWSTASTRR